MAEKSASASRLIDSLNKMFIQEQGRSSETKIHNTENGFALILIRVCEMVTIELDER